MSTKPKPVCETGPKWIKEVATVYFLKIGLSGPLRHILAPLTGQDWQAYRTFLHAVELYAYSDTDGSENALLCMKHAVLAMQPHTRWIARATIPHVLDWSDAPRLWAAMGMTAEKKPADRQPISPDEYGMRRVADE